MGEMTDGMTQGEIENLPSAKCLIKFFDNGNKEVYSIKWNDIAGGNDASWLLQEIQERELNLDNAPNHFTGKVTVVVYDKDDNVLDKDEGQVVDFWQYE